MARILQIDVFRHNPADPGSSPRMQTFYVDETESMTLFIALNRIREEHDPSLQFDFCCRAGVCGSCGMVINGRPGLACHTKTQDLPKQIVLLPLPVFQLIGDLSVDTGTWFRDMHERVESWIHTDSEFDPEALEEPMDNTIAETVFELDRCIECGCCIAACATARMRPDFLGAAGLNRIARFVMDPRDERTDDAFYELIGTDEGIFGCMSLLACDDVCPKGLSLQTQLAFVRRKMGWTGLKQLLPNWRRGKRRAHARDRG